MIIVTISKVKWPPARRYKGHFESPGHLVVYLQQFDVETFSIPLRSPKGPAKSCRCKGPSQQWFPSILGQNPVWNFHVHLTINCRWCEPVPPYQSFARNLMRSLPKLPSSLNTTRFQVRKLKLHRSCKNKIIWRKNMLFALAFFILFPCNMVRCSWLWTFNIQCFNQVVSASCSTIVFIACCN